MKRQPRLWSNLLALVSGMSMVCPALADTTITSFDNFTSDALYASWTSGTVVSGASSYSITATGYGSNWKYIGFPAIDGTGNTHLELRVTLSGPVEANGHLGPIVELKDADGSDFFFAFYGQTLGQHVLTMPVSSPSWTGSAGTTPGLDLATLTHMHMQLDPGGFGTSGAYTIEWENLSLITVPEPSSAVMVGLGSLVLWASRRRKV